MPVIREELFDEAEAAIAALEHAWPALSYLPSLRAQVAYLRAVQSGRETDRSRLSGINIGVIAAKDIEDRNADAARVLHKLASVARTMAAEKNSVA